MDKKVSAAKKRVPAQMRFLRESVREYPFVCLTGGLYYLWLGLAFQSSSVFENAFSEAPAWLFPVFSYAIAYFGIAMLFRKASGFARKRAWLVALAALMVLGIALCLVGSQSARSPELPSVLLYLLGVNLICLGTAGIMITQGRVTGYIGPRRTLSLRIVGMVGASACMALVFLLPGQVRTLIALSLPVLMLFSIDRMFATLPKAQIYNHGLDTRLATPTKLLATAALHGIPFGFALCALSTNDAPVPELPFNASSFTVGALLLLVGFLLFKSDFNRLVYVQGFPIMAAGLFLLIAFPTDPLAGCFVITAGYCFLHIAMSGVCSYLVKQFALPAPWLLAWTTCCFMLGQAIGAFAGILGGRLGASMPVMAGALLLVVLTASVHMVGGVNIRYAWGAVRPCSETSSSSPLELACQYIGVENSLTLRESEILTHLALGKSRKRIADELAISPETIKTHAKRIYQKLGVSSKEELIDFVQQRSEALER